MPSGIPFTLQVFAVSLCGFYLGTAYGSLSVLVYIILGIVGLPVFSGFLGGVSILFGKTGGFIIGFLPLCALCSASLKVKSKVICYTLQLCGILSCHLCGILLFCLIYKAPLLEGFLLLSLPYLLKDIICVFLSFKISILIKKRI